MISTTARSFSRMNVLGRRLFSASAAAAAADSTVGFVGLGNMGMHMANNLINAGRQVTVFDISKDAVAAAEAHGAQSAATPAGVAAASDVVITMLPSSPHVDATFTDAENGFLSVDCAGKLFIDSSTIDPAMSRRVAALAGEAGADMVDAPVSGGVGGAEAGTLTFMVGGSDDAFSRASGTLEHMGATIVHCGEVGTGEVAKLCNNLVLGISMAGVSEAMNLGKRLGIDPKKLAGIMNTSTGRCWSSDTYNPCPGVMDGVPSSRDYTGGFGSALMLKDLGLALDAAKASGSPTPMGASSFQMYSLLVAHGMGQKDFSSMFKFLEGEDGK
eukprot:g5318.t1